jgi:hypothetical protein
MPTRERPYLQSLKRNKYFNTGWTLLLVRYHLLSPWGSGWTYSTAFASQKLMSSIFTTDNLKIEQDFPWVTPIFFHGRKNTVDNLYMRPILQIGQHFPGVTQHCPLWQSTCCRKYWQFSPNWCHFFRECHRVSRVSLKKIFHGRLFVSRSWSFHILGWCDTIEAHKL